MMLGEVELLRARAITAYFAKCAGIDDLVRRRVFTFCRPSLQVAAYLNGNAFALQTDWGSVVTWGHAEWGGDSSGVAAELAGRRRQP